MKTTLLSGDRMARKILSIFMTASFVLTSIPSYAMRVTSVTGEQRGTAGEQLAAELGKPEAPVVSGVTSAKAYDNAVSEFMSLKAGEKLKLTNPQLNSLLWKLGEFDDNDEYMLLRRMVRRLDDRQQARLKAMADQNGTRAALDIVLKDINMFVLAGNALIFRAGAFEQYVQNWEAGVNVIGIKSLKSAKKGMKAEDMVEQNTHYNKVNSVYKVPGMSTPDLDETVPLSDKKMKIGDLQVSYMVVPEDKNTGRPELQIPFFEGEFETEAILANLEKAGIAVDVANDYGPGKEEGGKMQPGRLEPFVKRNIPCALASPVNKEGVQELLKKYNYDEKKGYVEVLYSSNRDILNENVMAADTLTCTSNAMITAIFAFAQYFNIERYWGKTNHSATDSNSIFPQMSGRSRDPVDALRGFSIVDDYQPASTGASKNLDKVIKNLKGKGLITAARMGTYGGSSFDLVFQTDVPVTADQVRAALKEFAQKNSDTMLEFYNGIPGQTQKPLDLNQIVGMSAVSIIDSFLIHVTEDGKQVYVAGYYDNQSAAPGQIMHKIAPRMVDARRAAAIKALMPRAPRVEAEKAVADVRLFAEGAIKGDEKGQSVARPMGLRKVKQTGLDGTLQAHSNNRAAFVNELNTQFKKMLDDMEAFVVDQAEWAYARATYRYNEIISHRTHLMMDMKDKVKDGDKVIDGDYSFKTFPVCLGSPTKNLPVKQEISEVLDQLEQMNISKEDLLSREFWFAWEPAGNIGTGQMANVKYIRQVHQAVYDWFVQKYGQETMDQVWGNNLKILYGASVDKNNIMKIMAIASTRVKGLPLIHGVLFASAGKKADDYVQVAKWVSLFGQKYGKKFVCFINLKQFTSAEVTPPSAYMAAIYRGVADKTILAKHAILAITAEDSMMPAFVDGRKTQQSLASKRPLPAVAVAKASDGGEAIAAVAAPSIMEFGRQELEGIRILNRPDINILDEAGQETLDEGIVVQVQAVKSNKRLELSMPGIIYQLDNGATPIVLIHNGRPDGSVKPMVSSAKVAEEMQKWLKAHGYDYEVVFHKDSITENGVKEGLRNEIQEGKINIIENTRFFVGEADNYSSMAHELGAICDYDHSNWDGFGVGERKAASTVGNAEFAQSISQGPLVDKENFFLEKALEKLHGLIFGGGPKLEEKFTVLSNVAGNLKEGDFLAPGSAPMTTFLKLLFGIELGMKVSDSNLQNGQKMVDLAKEKKLDFALIDDIKNGKTVDFIAIDKDPTARIVADKKDTWIEKKKVPDGAAVYTVKVVVENGAGKLVNAKDNTVMDSTKLFLVDLGPESCKLINDRILASQIDQAVFYNGTVGIFEVKPFNEGGKLINNAMAKATQESRVKAAAAGLKDKEVFTIIAGGDTVKEAEKNKVDDKVSHCSSGGGASAAKLQGKQLEVAQGYSRIQAKISAALAKLGVTLKEKMGFVSADKVVFNKAGGQLFRTLVSDFKKTMGVPSGSLKGATLTADTVKISRPGRPDSDTVVVTLDLGGISVKGYVAAGASTGGDEAATVPHAQALENVKKIQELLNKSNLDLRKYEDLRQAEKIMLTQKDKNGKPIDFGANATVPVSCALWRAAAQLNGVSLADYIRWNVPGAVRKGPVRFYMNIFNGGLHAAKKGEVLGVHRTPIQEIMIVTYTADRALGLSQGERVQMRLRKNLVRDFGEEMVTIADEAGFSVLGLGDSVKATEYVIQAIIDEGLKPGVDMGVAFDVAANSFFADGKYHLGKDASGNDIVLDRDGMIKYITDMVDLFQAKYGKGVITSVEDGLEENDFEGQAKLTVELKKRGVRTIGDDSFVTQEGRLVKGIKAGANDTILIKINQNGTLGGTLDVMTIANENDYESVVSHRSGETLDDIIADLADGTNAYGLKTGAPQPAELFSDPSKLVRRTKYLRMIKLQEAGAHNGKALVVGPEFFKETAGIRVGLNLIADELAQGVKVVLYGPSAENLKLLVGARNILTAATQEEALGRLTSLGFAARNVLVLKSAKDQAVKAQGVSVINAAKPSLIALAKAAETLINTDKATQALSTYYKGMADTGVISQETYSATKAAMVSTITGMLDVPSANVKYSDAVEQGIAAKSIAEKEFLNRV